jgi:hypothetical protein
MLGFMFVSHKQDSGRSLSEFHFSRFEIIIDPPEADSDSVSEGKDFLEGWPIGLVDGNFGMCVDLGRIIYVRIDSSFEYVFEKFGFGVFTVGQAGKVDI